MKQKKEVTTQEIKVVIFIIYAIQFFFSQWDWLTGM